MERIVTQRTMLTPASKNDLPQLREIDEACEAYFRFDPPCEMNHNCTLEECLTTGDIPTGISESEYKRENYHFLCIWQADTLIGYLSYYLEYQRKDTVYLCVLFIKESCRHSGIGNEIMRAMTQKFIAHQFKVVRLHCSLRNATALRFWVKNGFDRIVHVECDGNLFPENFGGVELMRSIATSK